MNTIIVFLWNVWDRMFNRWTKWELMERRAPYTIEKWRNGIVIKERIYFDEYKSTNKYTGIIRYKKILVD